MLKLLRRHRWFVALAFWLAAIVPAQAAVTITFWSHEFGSDFPHAFFTLRGVPDAGGAPVDVNYGFTAKSISPAILWGSVAGKIDVADQKYVRGSDAHFSVVLTDAQYTAILALIDQWGRKPDSRYNLNHHNCVHFVAAAARLAGLKVYEDPALMKKPRSFVDSLEAPNAGHIALIERPGAAYLDSLGPVQPATPAPYVPPADLPVPAAPVIVFPQTTAR